MQVLFVILKKVEIIEDLIKDLADAGLHGGTIIESTGMASTIASMDDGPIFGVLRRVLSNEDKESNKTLLFVVNDEELETAKRIIKKAIGDINAPNTGIMFAIPTTFVEGLGN